MCRALALNNEKHWNLMCNQKYYSMFVGDCALQISYIDAKDGKN